MVAKSINTNEQWFPMVLKWCRISSIHTKSPMQNESKFIPKLSKGGLPPSPLFGGKVL